MCWMAWNLGASTSWDLQDLSRPIQGLLSTSSPSLLTKFHYVKLTVKLVDRTANTEVIGKSSVTVRKAQTAPPFKAVPWNNAQNVEFNCWIQQSESFGLHSLNMSPAIHKLWPFVLAKGSVTWPDTKNLQHTLRNTWIRNYEEVSPHRRPYSITRKPCCNCV